MDNKNEIWRTIPGFSRYKVSNLGRVQSFTKKWNEEKILSPNKERGYLFVHIRSDDNEPITIRIHRLVMLAFVGPCPDGLEVCHNNGIKEDNRLENLRYDTRASNLNDKSIQNDLEVLPEQIKRAKEMLPYHTDIAVAKKLGVRLSSIKRIRENNNIPTVIETRKKQAGRIRELYATGQYKMQELADRFDISISSVSRIINQQRLSDGSKPIRPYKDTANKKGTSVHINAELLERMKIALGRRSLSAITAELYEMWLDGKMPIVIQPIKKENK